MRYAVGKPVILDDTIRRILKKQADLLPPHGITVRKENFSVFAVCCDNGEVVGVLEADNAPGCDWYVVHSIVVKESHRRRGIATAMWDAATEFADIRHSRRMTELGELWVASLGSPSHMS